MELTILREDLIKPLQAICSVVERKQTLPILANVKVHVEQQQLKLTATDLEVEVVAHLNLTQPTQTGTATIPARKWLDICRALPEGSDIHCTLQDNKAQVNAGKSRFQLATLNPKDFPAFEGDDHQTKLTFSQQEFLQLLSKTYFAMAQQDVRYFLNGLLLEVSEKSIRAVATDGHRLAMSTLDIDTGVKAPRQIIIPYKAVMEMLRLLKDDETPATLMVGQEHLKLELPHFQFSSKLIKGQYPEYQNVIPKLSEHLVTVDTQVLLKALSRAAILSQDQIHRVKLTLHDNLIHLTANNPEQEMAHDEVEVNYQGPHFEIGFNVKYLIDVLNAISGEQVTLSITDANASVRIESKDQNHCLYVVMPIRL